MQAVNMSFPEDETTLIEGITGLRQEVAGLRLELEASRFEVENGVDDSLSASEERISDQLEDAMAYLNTDLSPSDVAFMLDKERIFWLRILRCSCGTVARRSRDR